MADVVSDAHWGRVEECMAEDPLLVGAMVTAYVQNLQGDDHATQRRRVVSGSAVKTRRDTDGGCTNSGETPAFCGGRDHRDAVTTPR